MTNKTGWHNDRRIETTHMAASDLAQRINPDNPRTHPARQRDAVNASVDSLGVLAAIKYNEQTGQVFDGHLRIEEAMEKDPDVPLPVDVYNLTPEEQAAAVVQLDFSTELAGVDPAKMKITMDRAKGLLADGRLAGLKERLEERMAEAGGGLAGVEAGDVEPGVDQAEELLAEWQVEPGQLWQLGEHRVICGDCTSEAVVGRLMGGRRLADLCLTDPPYGINADKGFSGAVGFSGKTKPIPRRQYNDKWDQQRPTKETFNRIIACGNNSIIFGGNFFADILPKSTHWIVWDKLNTMPTFGDCELLWTNIKRKSVKKITFQYNGLIGKESERFHPTQKPVGLYDKLLKEYSKSGQIVLDPFLGSGTTLIAAHNENRICYGIEISPKYVAVVLQRFKDHTGIEPEAETA